MDSDVYGDCNIQPYSNEIIIITWGLWLLISANITPHMVSLPPQHNATTPFQILNVFFIFGRWDKYVISVREAKALPKTNSHHWKNKYICVEGMLFAVFNKLQPS